MGISLTIELFTNKLGGFWGNCAERLNQRLKDVLQRKGVLKVFLKIEAFAWVMGLYMEVSSSSWEYPIMDGLFHGNSYENG